MSYSNGLGNLQHLLNNVATNASQNSKVTDKPAVSTAGSGTSHISGISSVDGTQFSSTSSLVSAAISGPDVRTAKVAALQQTISAGTYNVSAGDVANSIIASLLG